MSPSNQQGAPCNLEIQSQKALGLGPWNVDIEATIQFNTNPCHMKHLLPLILLVGQGQYDVFDIITGEEQLKKVDCC